VTYDGGAFQRGSIFSVEANLQTGYRTLYEFNYTNGAYPLGPLLLATDGNFYGSASNGGSSPPGGGLVFRLTPHGHLTTLHALAGGAEGVGPNGGIIQASDGNLYGTTTSGTVFRLTLPGTFTTVYTFPPEFNWSIRDGVVQANDGYLYGRTWGGPGGAWTIFKMWLDGSGFQTLHTGLSGVGYCGGLVEGPDHNLYGTVAGDPVADQGTIFRITPTGSYGVLHIIDRFFRPYGPLAVGLDGALYGTTASAGPTFPGSVFRFAP
jgi:uncharacterized repeat protein (TIGR03803 family)